MPATKPTLSLSCCWNSARHTDGYAMMREIADLGFTHTELSHGVRITLVPGIIKAVQEGFIAVSSTHNFCPLPTGIQRAAPNLYEPSSKDSRERDQWVRQTKRSIDFAAQMRAKVLVCHLGSVRFFFFNPAQGVRDFAERHPDKAVADNKRFQAKVTRVMVKLRKQAPVYWANVEASVRAVLDHAMAKGVKLGFENREKLEELPFDDDFLTLLDALPADAPVGYWHDTGHAQIKHRMGVIDHTTHLSRYAPRALGFHLHDVDAAGHDHQPIGAGTIDFEMVSRHWRPEHVLVLEFSPRLSAEDVARSKANVEALLAQRF